LAATLEVHGFIEEERIAEAFDRIDSDSDGFITHSNLRKLLGAEATDERIDELINEADTNKDGKRK
jgi:Ca2+-binding EF-hand superfamily protein